MEFQYSVFSDMENQGIWSDKTREYQGIMSPECDLFISWSLSSINSSYALREMLWFSNPGSILYN